MSKNKIAFLSYVHEDKDFAERIARELRKEGIDVWIDTWEIKAADSLIQKIFLEGLSECDIFLILLSCASVKSKWVKEELDFAIIRKIEGVTRIIPLIKEQCEIPPPLRTLLWIDLSEDFNAGIRRIVKTIYDVSEKSPIGKIPEYSAELKNSVGGLSRSASTVGSILLNRQDDQLGFEKSYTAEEIHRLVPMLSVEEINDAVEELKEYGLVQTRKYFGTAPYNFGDVEPTYALFLHFKDELDYDPFEDIKTIASTVASKGKIDGNGIQELSGLRPVRINRAVAYLEDNGIVRVHRFLGIAPFSFGLVEATQKTNQREKIMKEEFIKAIRNRNKVRIQFYSKEDSVILTRVCAPMDYGPSRRAKVKSDRYHLWDYESDERMHTLSLNPEQIVKMEILEEHFNPAEFITWDTKQSPWFVKRDWGIYS